MSELNLDRHVKKFNAVDVHLLLQMKTVSVALVLCLNVGVDPPDVVKTSPCARLECWIGESTQEHECKITKHLNATQM